MRGEQFRMRFLVQWSVSHFRARGVSTKEVIAFPVFRWSDWPWHETTTTVGAGIEQNGIDARGAKRAFIRTNTRFERVGWQRRIAMLASWSEF